MEDKETLFDQFLFGFVAGGGIMFAVMVLFCRL